MKFESPVMEIVLVDEEDMITTSGFGGIDVSLGDDEEEE